MPRQISEERTRKQMIDPQLEQAGWYLHDHSRVKIEIPVEMTSDKNNSDQIRFLRAVQSVFLQKRRLETADLYEPPLDMFGADAVERWFDDREVQEMVVFTKSLEVRSDARGNDDTGKAQSQHS